MSTYDYGHNTPDDTPSGKKQTENEALSWVLIALSFTFFWPLGLFLLIRKLSDKGAGRESAKRMMPDFSTMPRTRTTQTASAASMPKMQTPPMYQKSKKQNHGSAKSFGRRMTKTPSMKSGSRKALKVIGTILMVCSAVSMGGTLMDLALFFPDFYTTDVLLLLQQCALFGGGALMLGKGISMDRAASRYASYLAILGNLQSISFLQLSEISGYPVKRVVDDLEHMIDKQYFPKTAYLDMSIGYFFRSRSAAESAAQQKREQAETPREAEEGYSGILREIRRANDCIADPALSKQIERLEEVTTQIFLVIEKHPEKEKQVRTLLEYYLPTTQKLLDSYAEFEAAGIEGENLRMAKEKIRATMDDIIRGFENQLDALYATAAMDIQSDIEVMNNMMKSDSATATPDFRVSGSGSAAAVEKKED